MIIRWLYSLLLYLLCPLILLHLWRRGKQAPGYRKRWKERFGYINPGQAQPNGVLFHCASVGEVVAATGLIKQIQQQHPALGVMISCNTPTGSEQINRNFAATVQQAYLPLDLPGAVRRFLNRLQPRLVCILETELWPNLIAQSRARGIPVLVVNARLSVKSLRGYQRFSALSRELMAGVSLLAAHNEEDGQRFVTLGLAADKLVTTGSIKFDISIDDRRRADAAQLKQQLKPQLGARLVWIAGSTHPGEDQQLLAVHQAVLAEYPDALLILVPRHAERFDPVAGLVEQLGLSLQRSSALVAAQEIDQPQVQCQVLLGDTMGQLATLYGVADVAFIGGSLIERGGHNPLEAAAFAIPVISGPHTFNFDHVYPELLQAGGCVVVGSADILAPLLLQLFDDKPWRDEIGRQGASFVAKNQGAIAHSCRLIGEYLV